jgi:hypothetical protein
MEHVLQPNGSSRCGQACLAMITGKPLEEVCEELQNYWYTNIEDLEEYLDNKQFDTFLSVNKLMDFDEIPDNSIIRFWKLDGKGHFIVKYEGKYYDPAIGIVEKYYKDVKPNYYLSYYKRTESNYKPPFRAKHIFNR